MRAASAPASFNVRPLGKNSRAARTWVRFRSRGLRCVAVLALAMTVGCAGTGQSTREQTAQSLAHAGRLTRTSIPADGFVLTAYARIDAPGQPANVYVEGDGLAWISRAQPSSDPTPRRPVALELAAVDPAPNVFYLARPCQYADLGRTPCDRIYWTDQRYSDVVISAMNQALDALLAPTAASRINLIGYSGGAAVAVLLAARRHDVASLRTVAGNLDSEAVNRYHGVSAMPQSLNPIDAAERLIGLPQTHFVGTADDVVPEFIAQSFARRAGGTPCARVVEVTAAAHDRGWQTQWPTLLGVPVACDANANVRNLDANSHPADAL